MLFLIGLSTTALWLPFLDSPAETPRWAALAVLAAAAMVRERLRDTPQPAINTVDWLVLGLAAWLALSLAWTPNVRDGIDSMLKLLWLGCCYEVGRRTGDLRGLIAGVAIGLGISSAMSIYEVATGHKLVVAETPQPAGLFVNSLSLSAAAAMALVGALALRMWWAAALVAPAALLSQGKATLLMLAGVTVWRLWVTGRPGPTMAGFAIIWSGAAGAVYLGRQGFFTRGSFQERWDIYSDTFRNLTWSGHGVGSFRDQFPLWSTQIDTLRWRVEHAHSDWLHLIAEGGIIAVAFAALACGLALPRVATRNGGDKWIILAAALLAVFGLLWRTPACMAMLAVAFGCLAGGGADVRRHAHEREPDLQHSARL